MKNTVRNNATSSNLKGKPTTKTIGLHWLQQVTKHVPAADEVSIHRAQLRLKLLYCHESSKELFVANAPLVINHAGKTHFICRNLYKTYKTVGLYKEAIFS